MDLSALKQLFFALDAPCLPSVAVAQAAMSVTWALVLGATLVWLGRSRRVCIAWPIVWLVLAWTLLPGALSPAYWLGLAFQSPSLTSALLCLMYLLQPQRLPAAVRPDTRTAGGLAAWPLLAGAGVVLGWLLLLDMLACWPVSLYAWGFSPAALAAACAVTALFWLTLGARKSSQSASALLALALVLVLFVLTRLPSGNLWDALLDPWLWIAWQVHTVRQLAGSRLRRSQRQAGADL